MKRAFPQKVKPVSHQVDLTVEVMEQPKQAPQGATRRARTSAAMLGLALSMGASSILLPRHTDGAAAAESRLSESVLAADSAVQAAILDAEQDNLSVDVLAAPVIDHTVQAGQTLWNISRQYQVSIDELARLNQIDANAVLRVGQTLKVPATKRSLQSVRTPIAPTPVVEPIVLSPEVSASRESRKAFKHRPSFTESSLSETGVPLERLRQARENLRQGLTELRSEEASLTAQVEKGVEASAEPPERFASESSAKPVNGFVYRVKPGDTLGAIADTHGISEQALAMANRLEDPDQLSINQPLTIPPPSAIESSVTLGSTLITAALHATEFQFPSVVPGVTPRPEQEIPVTELPDVQLYQVGAGDTIAQIARRHNVSRAELVSVNRLRNPDLIRVCVTWRIPVTAAASSRQQTVPTPQILASQETTEGQSDALLSAALPQSEGTPFRAPAFSEASVPEVPSVMPSSEVSESETFSPEASTASVPVVTQAPTVTPAEAQPTSRFQSERFVARLVSEVNGLSDRPVTEERENAVVSGETVTVVETAARLPVEAEVDRVNPQLRAAAAASSELQSPGFQRQLAQERAAQPVEAPAAAAQPQVVAAAPIGSENYAPLLEPITGRLVSPELPPLPGADNFLPNGSSVFTGFIWPARGVLTSGYGWRWGRMHRGLDIAAPVGTPIHAAAPGVVQFSGWNSGGFGNMVEIRHADGSMTRYAHNSRNIVRVGQRVEQGQQIALIGSTGFSTGPHVHFEIHLPNQGTVNPIAFLPRRGR